VASNGLVSVDNQMFSVGNAYKAQLVDVFVDDTVIQVWSKNHLIKTVARTRTGRVRKAERTACCVPRRHLRYAPEVVCPAFVPRAAAK
jgi:uncharacterized protein YifN (PemK superfamily)